MNQLYITRLEPCRDIDPSDDLVYLFLSIITKAPTPIFIHKTA